MIGTLAWRKLAGLAVLSWLIVMIGTPGLSGKAILPVALDSAAISATEQPQAARLQVQGRQHYEAGQFAAAVQVWQQATAAYQQEHNKLQQALVLSYLAAAQQNLGNWDAAMAALEQGQTLLDNSNPSEQAAIRARLLNSQATLQLAMGQPQAALETGQQAAALYEKAADQSGVWGSQINQAQALQSLGLYRRAQALLTEVNQALQAEPDSALKATGLHSLGAVLQAVGNLEAAQRVLEQSLDIARHLNLPLEISTAQLSLANTLWAQQTPDALDQAVAIYQAVRSPSEMIQLEAQLNYLRLMIQSAELPAAQTLLPSLLEQIAALAPSRRAIYARVQLAESWLKLQAVAPTEAPEATKATGLSQVSPTHSEVAAFLATAVQQAQELGDTRAESFSLGQLAKLYQQTQQWQTAKSLTQKALLLAQTVNANDIAYRWQWQLGQISQLEQTPSGHAEALSAYAEAIKTLKVLRRDLLAMSQEVQFSFRDSVEPVYREYVELLLRDASTSADSTSANKTATLKQARAIIEDLQLAELENFFRLPRYQIAASRCD
jgi:tetratricopeptide (TPR) repeat protein